jgi:hypothetical protein
VRRENSRIARTGVAEGGREGREGETRYNAFTACTAHARTFARRDRRAAIRVDGLTTTRGAARARQCNHRPAILQGAHP